MNRKEFIRNSALFGLSIPIFSTLLAGCQKNEALFQDIPNDFDGKVLIIGAGAAGITAGYILARQGIDFQIIEAAPQYGGRIKKIEGFADFPIDLGGEWIHTDPKILSTLINDRTVDASIGIINYNPHDIYVYKNGRLVPRHFVNYFYAEHKFKDSTWFDFFDTYFVPKVRDQLILNSPVRHIDYSGDQVVVQTAQQTYTADKVIVTVPIKILQEGMIEFSPQLPSDFQEALGSIDIPPIMKVFMEFSERFFPDIILLDGLFQQNDILYDAGFGKDTNSHVLGLFTVGDLPAELTQLSDEGLKTWLLNLLDDLFDGKASQTYIKHVVQDWNKEPFIRGSYSYFEGAYNRTIETLRRPLGNKVYFAGEALTYSGHTATVHGASQSAYEVIEELLS
ncbi:MAG: NAD(P)/FAD-dependent oxidoreductase [Bacteroidota bacterium]